MNYQASHKTAMILSERGYAVKERGVIKVGAIVTLIIIMNHHKIIIIPIQVKGKGLMRTYFVLGRKISRGRYGKGGSGAANTSLAEVILLLLMLLLMLLLLMLMLMMMLMIWKGRHWGW